MLKVTCKILKTAKLPLSICHGSEAQRFAMSRQMSERLLAKLPEEHYSAKHLTNIVNELLSPNKIDFVVDDFAGGSNVCGATRLDLAIGVAGSETIDVGIKGYKILLKKLKNGLYDKYTALHEFGHLFDHIYNPKISNFSISKLLFNEGVEGKVSMLKSLFLNKTNKMHELEKTAQALLKEIPDEYAIDALQSIRGHLKTEIHQYQFEIRTLFKDGKFGEYCKEIVLLHKLKYKKKIKLVNELLEERLALTRENIAKKKR